MDLENVWVKDTPEATIGTDGIINLSKGQDRLDLMFDLVHQVSAIKITVFDTTWTNNRGLINELLVHPCK